MVLLEKKLQARLKQKRLLAGISADGKEVIDPKPARLNVRQQKIIGLTDQVKSIVNNLNHEAMLAAQDSEEEDRDFEIDSDDPRSPHEDLLGSPEFDKLISDIENFRDKALSAAEDTKPSPKAPPAKPAAAKKGTPPPAAPDPQEDTD